MKWGMRFRTEGNSPVPVGVPGRILPSEELRFQNSSVKPSDQADWTMAFRSEFSPNVAWCMV